ncbi:MAG: hypothetical protein LBF93_12945 [Zoogloeaceae bacterium]|jgi:hypothetical protein|nr:hypothetical protein [Zoogloeaceae bacterium]
MNKAFLFVLAAAISLGAGTAPENNVQPEGEPIMTQAYNPTAEAHQLVEMEALEKFNNPDNFFSIRKSFDMATFRKNAPVLYSGYDFVREDGVHVRQSDFGDKYKEEFTRPDSHYRYSIMYTLSGKPSLMAADFSRIGVREILYFDEKGNIVKRKDEENGFLPIEKLREKVLEAMKIDIYDKKQVFRLRRGMYDGKAYYDIFVNNDPPSFWLLAYLLDGVTGKFLFMGGRSSKARHRAIRL